MSKIILPTSDQIFGNNKRINSTILKIFKEYGSKCALSDLAILRGAYFNNNIYLDNKNDLISRTGWWWTMTPYSGNARAVGKDGRKNGHYVDRRDVGVRPALTFSDISEISPNIVRGNDFLEFTYGEYPQYAVDANMQNILYSILYTNGVNLTGKKYTFDERKYNDYNNGFSKIEYPEYEYNGERYILVDANTCFDGEEVTLSNGLKVKDKDKVWIKVEPIKWIWFQKENIAISKIILLAGIQFNEVSNYNDINDFSNMNMGKYLDEIFSKEIIKQATYTNSNVSVKKPNPFNLDIKNVSEEEIIKGCLESDLPVFLHGLPGDGKSARVKNIDKDATIVDLGTSNFEGIVGLIVKDLGSNNLSYIEPYWYKELCEKCERENDKIHILFLDELTNAPGTIQKAAYEIILNKTLTNSGFRLKLPDNVRIIAAGNDVKDSIVATEMPEPLFDRFVHVWIKTDSRNWLKWAYESNIHPSICAYIAFRGDIALRTEYTGEKPNADPRKWEMASKMLYKTNNPKMLRGLIGSEMTEEFCKFCSQKVITIEDVLNNNYTKEDLDMDYGKQNATILSLSYVDEEYIEEIRKFVVNNFSPELIKLFDLWFIQNGDEGRVLIIDSLENQNESKGVKIS
ncbi:MAG: sigma 54-interacting transcriptional regulator [Bacilli bacterium]|nr:sigma 54-interacting transcriptional regulator [Bacilli bacterium]